MNFSSILLQLNVIIDGKFEVRNKNIDWTLEFQVAFSLPYSTGVTAISDFQGHDVLFLNIFSVRNLSIISMIDKSAWRIFSSSLKHHRRKHIRISSYSIFLKRVSR